MTVKPPPLVSLLEELILPKHINSTAALVGIAPVTLHNWFRHGRDPRLSLFEATLNAVGYRLEIVPMETE